MSTAEQKLNALDAVRDVASRVNTHTDSASMASISEALEVVAAILKDVVQEMQAPGKSSEGA